MRPNDIENESFRLIEKLVDYKKAVSEKKFNIGCWPVIRRMIHACGDIDIVNSVKLSENILEAGVTALSRSADIVCDVNMVAMGISKEIKARHQVHCFINNPDVIRDAAEHATTRAKQAMIHAAALYPEGIYVIGNAPTALLSLLELYNEKKIAPALVIGIPVGFVMAVESKELLRKSELNFITNLGFKGGSPMAAAAMNALYKIG